VVIHITILQHNVDDTLLAAGAANTDEFGTLWRPRALLCGSGVRRAGEPNSLESTLRLAYDLTGLRSNPAFSHACTGFSCKLRNGLIIVNTEVERRTAKLCFIRFLNFIVTGLLLICDNIVWKMR
jgi:hypothetical protein